MTSSSRAAEAARLLAIAVSLLVSLTCRSADGPAEPVAREIRLNLTEVTLDQGDSVQLLYTVFDNRGAAVTGSSATFTSGSPAIVTVSSTGMVKSVGPAGTTEIQVVVANLTRAVPVVVRSVATKLEVTPNPVAMPQKGTRQLDARLLDRVGVPVPNAVVTYESSAPATISVSASGLITSLGPAGSVSVIVRSGPFVEAIPVVIAQVPTRLEVLVTPFKVVAGRTRRILTRLLDAIDDEIKGPVLLYTSSKPAVVTVSDSGVVTSVADIDTATVTVRVFGSTVFVAIPVTVVSGGHPDGVVSAIPIAGGVIAVALVSETEAYASNVGGNVSRLDLIAGTATPVSGSHGGPVIAAVPRRREVYSSIGNGSGIEVISTGATPRVSATIQLPAPVLDIVITPDERIAYATLSNQQVAVISISTHTYNSVAIGLELQHAVLDPYYPALYGTHGFGDIFYVDLESRLNFSFTSPDAIFAQSIAESSDGYYLYVASDYGSIEEFDLYSLERTRAFRTCAAWGLRLSPDDRQLYVSCSTGQILIIDTETGNIVTTVPSGGSRAVAVSPEGFIVAVAGPTAVTIIK